MTRDFPICIVGFIVFFLTVIILLKKEFIKYEKVAVETTVIVPGTKNTAVRYTAIPGRRTIGFMKPFVLQLGEETVPIGNFEGTYFRWDLIDGEKMPNIYSRVGHKGPWVKGCQEEGWWYKFVLPSNAPGPVTLHVQRERIPSGGMPNGVKANCT